MDYRTKPKSNLQARNWVKHYFNIYETHPSFNTWVINIAYFGIYSDGAAVYNNACGAGNHLPFINSEEFTQEIDARRHEEYAALYPDHYCDDYELEDMHDA